MTISRRDFFKYCSVSAGALALCGTSLHRLEAALESDGAPTVVWLHGSGCQGDSVSFLNRIAEAAPPGQRSVDDILIHSINLAYHSVLMASQGETALLMAEQAKRKGGYVLVMEGAVPQAFGGAACEIGSYNGQGISFQQAIQNMASGAAALVCVGTCACFGGISAAGENPTNAAGVGDALGLSTINIPGCPAHPDWITWAIVQLILGNSPVLDEFNRPTAIYGGNVHENCPRNIALPGNSFATTFGEDGKCLENLGCRGPLAHADCPSRKWNNGQNWCVDANAMCFGCTQPTFPGGDFYS